jgi:hypothetical protein
MGEERNAYRSFMGNSEGKDHKEDLDVGQRIISKWILEIMGCY